MNVDRLLELRRVTSLDVSPDARTVVVAAEVPSEDHTGWHSHLWRVPVHGDAPPERLTSGPHRHTRPRFQADGTLCFLSDQTGRAQVSRLTKGQVQVLTDLPLGARDFQIAAEGFVVLADVLPKVPWHEMRERARRLPARHYTSGPLRFWDRWLGPDVPHLLHVRSQDTVDLTPDALHELVDTTWQVSARGDQVALTLAHPVAKGPWERSLAVIDLRARQLRVLGETQGARHEQPRWSPDGHSLATRCHLRGQGAHGAMPLVVTEVATGQSRRLTAGTAHWPLPLGWSAQGVLATSRIRERVAIVHIHADTGALHEVTTGPGSHREVQVVGEWLFGLHSTLLSPPEPFACALDGEGRTRRLSNVSGVRSEERAPFQITWEEHPGHEGAPVHTAMVRSEAGGPLLLWVHGGPVSHWCDGWSWRWNPLPFAAAGYTVALPNPRGSTGYGQGWVDEIFGHRWGDTCAGDLLEVTGRLAQGPCAVMGGSFGGWMVNWLCASTERYTCAVSHAGIFDHDLMKKTCDSPGEWAWHQAGLQGHPVPDRFSPSNQTDAWRTPVLVTHGEADCNVPVSQAIAQYHALTARGVPCELMILPGEGHWVQRPASLRHWVQQSLAFLGKHLRSRNADTSQ
jgi:dipeptidyl aminopeptidase/acylaminoacyl peptidase